MMNDSQYDVFLSHNSKDKPTVEWLAAKLTDQAGLTVFLGPAGISGWHNEELRNALSRRVSNRDQRVIPVLLPGTTMPEDDEIPSFLQRLTWVDFRKGLDDEDAFHRLVAGIKGEAPGRSDAPGEHKPPPKPAPKPKEKEKSVTKTKVDTDGGAYISGNVNTGGGDFDGRDKNVTAGERGVAIGGNVSGSTIITGDYNVVGSTVTLQDEYIQQIFIEIDKHPSLDSLDKEDLKSEVKELQKEEQKGPDSDETRISRHLRNIKRMAPDILEVVIETIKNPVAGFGVAARKVAERMQAELQ